MNKVSVVVPIYNVEKYLRNCLESIAKQTYKDFDCYMVNDGSPDNSQNIIDEYAKKYPDKFIPIIKENGGYGSALELAFNKTDSEFVLVCDGDDTLKENCLEDLINIQEKNNCDLVVGSKNLVYEDSEDIDYSPSYNTSMTNLYSESFLYTKDNLNTFNDLYFIDPSPHSKLYKTEIVKNIKFPNKIAYTDNLLFYYALNNSNSVIYSDKPLANYLINRKGNSMSDVSIKGLKSQITVFNGIYDQCNKIECPKMFYYRMFESFKFILYQTRNLNCDKEEYKELFDYLKTFLDRLVNHENDIKEYYDKYNKNGFIEKLRDKALLNKNKSNKEYIKLYQKMYKEKY